MSKPLTISQLNKIGERLRKNAETEEDLRQLDEFRTLFEPAYEEVFEFLTTQGLNPGGRQGKTTDSIRAKLIRERTRLSRMQDIAGCRIEVDNIIDQDRVVDKLKARWPEAQIQDRRAKPSWGYRAVHLVVAIDGRLVEIQVRTSLQHMWASATEKLSDLIDPQIKYGGGPLGFQQRLLSLSALSADMETAEKELWEFERTLGSDNKINARADSLRAKINANKDRLQSIFQDIIIFGNDISNSIRSKNREDC